MYIEQNCTIEHENRTFESGGAYVDDNYVIGYVGDVITDCPQLRKSRHKLTNWHGEQIGIIYLSSSWRINSHLSDRMYQAYAWVNGKEYTGRTLGNGMVFKGKRTASDLKKS